MTYQSFLNVFCVFRSSIHKRLVFFMTEMAKGIMPAIDAVAAILSSVIMNKIGEKKSIV